MMEDFSLPPTVEDDVRALEGGWIVTRCRCALCAHEWVSVWPLDLETVNLDDEAAVSAAIVEGIPNLQCSGCQQQGSTIEREANDE